MIRGIRRTLTVRPASSIAWAPAVVVMAAVVMGAVTAGVFTVVFVMTGPTSGTMVAISIKVGLLMAIPSGAVVGLVAVFVGFGIRGLVKRGAPSRTSTAAVVAGVGVAVVLISALIFLGAGLGLSGVEWWPVLPCVLGAVGFGCWARARDRDARAFEGR